jgi:hypothetical protein
MAIVGFHLWLAEPIVEDQDSPQPGRFRFNHSSIFALTARREIVPSVTWHRLVLDNAIYALAESPARLLSRGVSFWQCLSQSCAKAPRLFRAACHLRQISSVSSQLPCFDSYGEPRDRHGCTASRAPRQTTCKAVATLSRSVHAIGSARRTAAPLCLLEAWSLDPRLP